MSYCLYHASCADGFGATWCVWKVFKENFTYIPVHYNEPVPEAILKDNDINYLFIVDFSYPLEILKELEKRATYIVVIDHHKTAQKELENWIPINGIKIFDMSHSGTILTWNYLNPSTNAPEFLKYIEDRDLWKWELPQSREFSAGLQLLEMDFNVWDNLTNLFDLAERIHEGTIILKYQTKLVKDLAKKAEIVNKIDLGTQNSYKVATLNSCLFQSELGEYLCHNMDIDYAEIYFIKNGKTIHSLRSKGDFDVSVIAKAYGGGGHKNAAGYTT